MTLSFKPHVVSSLINPANERSSRRRTLHDWLEISHTEITPALIVTEKSQKSFSFHGESSRSPMNLEVSLQTPTKSNDQTNNIKPLRYNYTKAATC